MPTTVPVFTRQDRPLQKFIYSRVVPDMAVNIAFVETETITPDCVLNINECLNMFPENKDFYSSETEYLDDQVKSYAIKSRHFKLTNKFNAYNDPLFYRHKLRFPVWVNQYDSTNVALRDNVGNKVDPKSYYYDSQTATVYHNLSNYTSEEVVTYYYVEYISADDNNEILDSTHKEILNSLMAFIPIDYTMLTCINRLSMHANGYIINYNKDVETKQAYPFILTVPTLGKWAIQYTNGDGLRLHLPIGTDVEQPWYVPISFDYLERVYEYSLDGQTTPYIYTILEFNNQYFNPYPPYTLAKLEKAQYVDSTVIKVAHINLLVEINYPLEVLVTDARGNYKYAFSTNLEQSSTIAPTIEWLPIDIDDIDKANGFINLRASISYTDICNVTYFYENNYYLFTAKNFNPRFDNGLFLQETLIYCKPVINDPYNTTVLPTHSIFYVVFHMDGSVYDLEDDWAYVSNDPDLHVDNDLHNELIINNKDEFLEEFAYPNGKRWLVLGSITAMHPSSVTESIILDSRTQGGGLKEITTSNTSMFQSHPEINWYWDLGHWDGFPFPGAGAVVVIIPDTLLDTYTRDEIYAKIKKHMACGVYPIVNYGYQCGEGYGASPYGVCPYGD